MGKAWNKMFVISSCRNAIQCQCQRLIACWNTSGGNQPGTLAYRKSSPKNSVINFLPTWWWKVRWSWVVHEEFLELYSKKVVQKIQKTASHRLSRVIKVSRSSKISNWCEKMLFKTRLLRFSSLPKNTQPVWKCRKTSKETFKWLHTAHMALMQSP